MQNPLYKIKKTLYIIQRDIAKELNKSFTSDGSKLAKRVPYTLKKFQNFSKSHNEKM